MPTHDATLEQFSLSEDQAGPMRLSHQKAIERRAMETAGWHNFDDIKTLAGLEGSYLWLENAMLPGVIGFKFDPGREDSETYAIKRAGVVVEKGLFRCVPNNPVIGWAVIGLEPDSGANSRAFVFWGMLTNDAGLIQLMILSRLEASGPSLTPFAALRAA